MPIEQQPDDDINTTLASAELLTAPSTEHAAHAAHAAPPLADAVVADSRAAAPQPADESADRNAMREAFAQARLAIGLTEPNPRVGCVISRPTAGGGWRVLGRGHTQQAGGPHAEVMALRDAAASGEDVRGACVHVTLEPCAHHGRTPPCCDALIAAGVARVVYAVEDPYPQVAGRGAARLREAGIATAHGEPNPAAASVDDPLGAIRDAGIGNHWADEARELNIGFFSRVLRHRPWVRLKAAVSLDGRSALDNGASQWITGAAARTDGHRWRRRAGALMTGVGTVQDDDPRLDVRLVETARQPLRVIVDSKLLTPAGSRILQPPGDVLIYTAASNQPAASNETAGTAWQPIVERRTALQATGAEIASIANHQGKVDLPAMLADLARRGVNELHVEAGAKLSGSFVREGLVDEYLVYLAPRLLGQGRPLAAFGPLNALADAAALRFHDVERIGDDLRIVARPVDGWHPR